ncbi:hypothetical protein POM88_002651 [Heracleum sosnowskyi]|uniref:NIN-like protein n=1 Tax=Heracleum sosnowskyi TaxID=360622 RepID=A0AAD8JI24_9APIA|nr:hypothetical protein POM88_002651 [Heracleum sosnowskyi]
MDTRKSRWENRFDFKFLKPVRQERNLRVVRQKPWGKWSAGIRKSVDKTRIWLDAAQEAALADFDFGGGLCSGDIAKYREGLLSHRNKFTAQEENNIAQPVNETYTSPYYPIVESDWDSILQQEQVEVGNNDARDEANIGGHIHTTPWFCFTRDITNNTINDNPDARDEANIGGHIPTAPWFCTRDITNNTINDNPGLFNDLRSPVSQFQCPVSQYPCFLGDGVVKELPVQDAGYAMNAESRSSIFQTGKSPPQEIVEIEKDLVILDHLHQLPFVEDSIHEKELVVGAEKHDTYIYVSSQTCQEETSKERKSPEKGYSYDILSAHFGKLLDDAAKYFNVSRSTFKRICRDNGIKRWQFHKKKLNSQSSSKLGRVNNEEPSRTKSYRRGISSLRETDMITVKATYNEIAIKFEVLDSSGMVDLEDNVIERLKMKRDTFSIKYQDDEGDWVLIACDKDLQKCIKTSRLLKKTTIKMLVDRPINHYAS